jgi:hypothetical protein
MNQNEFREKLEQSRNYREIFALVKRSAKDALGLQRSGLMLYLEELPLNIGAFHQIGSNGIVLNRRLLRIMPKTVRTATGMNSFLFTILLHEYLHSLGYLDEQQVRNLVHKISLEAFGSDHPTVQMALNPPFPRIPLPDVFARNSEPPEIIKDFEEPRQMYIV